MLAVPEQQRAVQHRSRSVSPHREDSCRARSRPAHVPMQRSLDEIHQNRHHSPSHYHEPHLEHQRSGDSDYEYSEDSEVLEMHRSVRGGSAECLHTNSDLQPSLDRVRSASTTCLRPDSNFHSPDRDRSSNSLPRKTPPSPRILVEHVGPEEDRQCSNSSSPNCHRGSKKSLEGERAHPHGSPSPPTGTPSSGRRVRQLPQLPAKSSSIEHALAVEERARQIQMKEHSYRPSASHGPETDLKTKREKYAEQRRSSDNMSTRSSDSDMSDMSALSRASSASRLSSTSYMSIQSERPGGRLRSLLACLLCCDCPDTLHPPDLDPPLPSFPCSSRPSLTPLQGAVERPQTTLPLPSRSPLGLWTVAVRGPQGVERADGGSVAEFSCSTLAPSEGIDMRRLLRTTRRPRRSLGTFCLPVVACLRRINFNT